MNTAAAAPKGAPSCGAVSSGTPSLKQCTGCGCVYTHSEFFGLPSFREWRIAGDWLGIAECKCNSTISVRMGDDPESAS